MADSRKPGKAPRPKRGERRAEAAADEEMSPLQFFERCMDEGQEPVAMQFARELAGAIDELETRARWWLELGLAMERRNRFEVAAHFYGEGAQLEPAHEDIAYWLFNNRGFSLNQVGSFEIAEQDCRRAIEISPLRHNAWKNLGVALEGRKLYPEAARAYLTAARACFPDGRALVLLEHMLVEHAGVVLAVDPDFGRKLAELKQAIEQWRTAGRRPAAGD